MSQETPAARMAAVQKRMSAERYMHTLGVAYFSAALSARYDTGLMESAFTAGLFHDVAKELPAEDMLRLSEENGIPVSPAECRNPVLLHGKLGAFIAETEFAVTDEAVLNAIRYHTTGRPEMTLLEKIVFTADYIEPLRKKRLNDTVMAIRTLAFTRLDAAIARIAQETLLYLQEKGKEIDPITEETYRYYLPKAVS